MCGYTQASPIQRSEEIESFHFLCVCSFFDVFSSFVSFFFSHAAEIVLVFVFVFVLVYSN